MSWKVRPSARMLPLPKSGSSVGISFISGAEPRLGVVHGRDPRRAGSPRCVWPNVTRGTADRGWGSDGAGDPLRQSSSIFSQNDTVVGSIL
jgi:hypothetical protein